MASELFYDSFFFFLVLILFYVYFFLYVLYLKYNKWFPEAWFFLNENEFRRRIYVPILYTYVLYRYKLNLYVIHIVLAVFIIY